MMANPFERGLQRMGTAAAAAAERAKRLEILDSLVSAATLAEFLERRLKGRKLILASNREPYEHRFVKGSIRAFRSAGGVSVALDAIAAACGAIWICHGSGDADFYVTDSDGLVRVPPKRPRYTLRRLALTPEEEQGYYQGFSNEALWPLCHQSYVRPRFRLGDWNQYRSVNARFASAIAESSPQGAIVFIQDYHLALCAKFLKASRPDLSTVLFWHIPWPSPEIFRICPYKRELLEGLLANDILGFHLRLHADNFFDTVGLELEHHLDRERRQLTRASQLTRVRSYPISVDFDLVCRQAEGPEAGAAAERIIRELGLEGLKVGLSVDRLDYTKGIPERLAALDCFFERHPEWRGRFSFIQIGVPTRSGLAEYQETALSVGGACERLNARFATSTWKPVIYINNHLDFDALVPYYRLADLCMVSSLHDGMNLVAKEFVAASGDGRGVLILSPFTGAAQELEQALQVNPYDNEAFAAAIHAALLMPRDEQQARLSRMREQVAENNIYHWAQGILQDLVRLADDRAAENPSNEDTHGSQRT